MIRPQQSPDDILDAEDVATLLGCSEKQVEELARAGRLLGAKIGRPWRFLRRHVVQLIADTAEQSAPVEPPKASHPAVTPARRRPPPDLPQPSA
jgi:excisionase family DNA binding protein